MTDKDFWYIFAAKNSKHFLKSFNFKTMEGKNEHLFIVKANKNHGFASFSEARKWAKENIIGDIQQPIIGVVNISGKAIEKFLSEKAVDKSTTKDAHLSALKVLPNIIENSLIGEIHYDRDNNPNIRDIVRLYGYVIIGDDNYRVKTTIKRYNDKNLKSKAYSYEVTKIELLEGFSATTHTHSADFVPTSNNSISNRKDTTNF